MAAKCVYDLWDTQGKGKSNKPAAGELDSPSLGTCPIVVGYRILLLGAFEVHNVHVFFVHAP
jgi:hypothetical protein